MPVFSFGQDLDFAFSFGSTPGDQGQCVMTDAAGNFYLTGYLDGITDIDPSAATVNLTTNGQRDIFVAKFDPNGTLLWAFNVGGSSGDEGNGMYVDPAGNVYLAGEFRGTADFDPSSNTFSLTSNGGLDAFFAKYDASGQFLWAFNIGGSEDDMGFAIGADGSGNAFVTGRFRGTVDFNPSAGNAFSLTSNGGFDAFVAKYNPSGNFGWAFQLGGDQDDIGFSLAVDNTGSAYIGGNFSGQVDFNPSAGTSNLTSNGGRDIFLAKYSPNGSLQWAFQTGGNQDDEVGAVALDNNNNLLVTGSFSAVADFDPSGAVSNLVSNGFGDVFLAKYSPAGAFQWAFNIGGAGSDIGYGITAGNSDDVYVTGEFRFLADFDPAPGTAFNQIAQAERDIFIAKYSSSGDFRWAFSAGNTSQDTGFGLDVDPLENLYVTGFFRQPVDMDPSAGTTILTANPGGTSTDVFLAKYSPCYAGFGITNTSSFPSYLHVCEGNDLVNKAGSVVFSTQYQTPAFVPGAGSVYNYLLFDNAGNLLANNASGDFDFSVYTSAGNPYTVCGIRFKGTQVDLDAYLAGKTRTMIENDDRSHSVCLDLLCSPAPGTTNEVVISGNKEAGTGGAQTICEGASGLISLFDLLTGADPGLVWVADPDNPGTEPFDPEAGTFDPSLASPGTYLFYYRFIAGSGCTPDEATVTITVADQKSAGMGTTLELCQGLVGPVDLFSLLEGEDPGGTWTADGDNPSGGIFNAGNGTFDPDGASAGIYNFLYSFPENPPCTGDSETVTIFLGEPKNPGTGGVEEVCGPSTSVINLFDLLSGEDPGGTWEARSNNPPGGEFDPLEGTFGLTGATPGSYFFRYGFPGDVGCPEEFEEVSIVIIPEETAFAGLNQHVCDTTGGISLTANTPVFGTGEWSLISGSATITDPSDPQTTITDLVNNQIVTLRWAISNEGCSSSDNVVIRFEEDLVSVTYLNFTFDQGTYYASISIEASGTVKSPADVRFRAGETIVLKPGFKVEEGATFSAAIGECVPGLPATTPPLEQVVGERGDTSITVLSVNTLPDIEEDYSLKVFPNPFHSFTTVEYTLPVREPVWVGIYDLTGRLLEVLERSGEKDAGVHRLEWLPENWSPGMYYLVFRTENQQVVRKIVRTGE